MCVCFTLFKVEGTASDSFDNNMCYHMLDLAQAGCQGVKLIRGKPLRGYMSHAEGRMNRIETNLDGLITALAK